MMTMKVGFSICKKEEMKERKKENEIRKERRRDVCREREMRMT